MVLLLDTNAYSDWKRGHVQVANLIRNAEKILLSSIVAGELLFGFHCGSRYQKNLSELHAFLDSPYVTFLPITITTADRFARVAKQLKSKGRPIPTNDVWIAAHAMQTGATLVSSDAHFSAVDGLVFIHPHEPGC